MAHYLDPKNDLTFKRVFGEHKHLCMLANKLTREAVGYMEKAAYTKEQLEVYDKWKIAAMTERSALKDARIEGKIEGKIEIAKNLLRKGMSIEEVSDVTGLSIQKIKEVV